MSVTRRSRFRAVVSRLKAFSSYVDAFTTWGTKWKVTSGSWSTSGGKSKTTTSASSYPLAAVQMSKSNVTATVKSPQPGAGIALWVTDSGNWWGVVREQTVNNSYNCGSCQGSFTNPYFFVALPTNPGTTNPPPGGGTNPPPGGTAIPTNPASFFYLAIFNQKYYNPPPGGGTNPTNPGTAKATNPGTTNPPPGGGSSLAGGNTSYFFFTCNCSSSYPQTIRLIRSISGSVSTITSWTVGAATDVINAIRVINSGTGLTIRAYSDTNATTQIGSDMTHTATGATVTTQFGIVLSPATNGQGDGTGELSVTSN